MFVFFKSHTIGESGANELLRNRKMNRGNVKCINRCIVFGLLICVCYIGLSVPYPGPNSFTLFSNAAFTALIFSSSSVRLQA